jgi:hypothetical protein
MENQTVATTTPINPLTPEEYAESLKYHTANVIDAFIAGWTWVPDNTHPKRHEMSWVDWNTSDHGYGWYTKPGTWKERRDGDSVPRWVAADVIKRLGWS